MAGRVRDFLGSRRCSKTARPQSDVLISSQRLVRACLSKCRAPVISCSENHNESLEQVRAMPLEDAKSAAAIDPVCGMTVHPPQSVGSHQFEGRTYYFCS